MTTPRWDEVNQIQYMDQLLAYCVCTLDIANRDSDNFWWKNAAARPEGKFAVNWEITKDDNGNIFLVFAVILDYFNLTPLLSKASLSQSILTGSPYQIKPGIVTIPSSGQGFMVPPIPPQLDTLEKLIYWCTKCIESVFIKSQFLDLCNQYHWVPLFDPILNNDL